MIRPTLLVHAISRIYGSVTLRPLVPCRWFPCPECARYGGRRMSVCRFCGGPGRIEAWPQ